ncbi:hypothetical protein ACNKHL_08510 [Shigella flexneri]
MEKRSVLDFDGVNFAEYGADALPLIPKCVARKDVKCDAMTGLYNRKILTPELEQRLQKLVQSGSSASLLQLTWTS